MSWRSAVDASDPRVRERLSLLVLPVCGRCRETAPRCQCGRPKIGNPRTKEGK